MFVQCALEVLRNDRPALRRIRTVQPTISLGQLVFPEASRFHTPLGDQFLCALAVDRGPPAARLSGAETQPEELLIVASKLTIYPTEAHRFIDSFSLGHRWPAGTLLRDLEPDTR